MLALFSNIVSRYWPSRVRALNSGPASPVTVRATLDFFSIDFSRKFRLGFNGRIPSRFCFFDSPEIAVTGMTFWKATLGRIPRWTGRHKTKVLSYFHTLHLYSERERRQSNLCTSTMRSAKA